MTKRRKAHPCNKYADRQPDFAALAEFYPSFAQFVSYSNDGKRASINWTDYNATRELTRVLLEHDYGIKWWIPDGQLCPTVTNRANYIHWIEDLLSIQRRDGQEQVTGLDIGTGANCIYPLLGAQLHNWRFVATDITPVALEWAATNVQMNPSLEGLIEVRNAGKFEPCDEPPILCGVIKEEEELDFCMCNPPFFDDIEKAGLNPKTACGGTSAEMVCNGGEAGFIARLIQDSIVVKKRIHWYTTMVGRKINLKLLTSKLRAAGVRVIKTTEFVQGRTSRWGLAWSFWELPTTNSLLSQIPKTNLNFMLDGLNRSCNCVKVMEVIVDELMRNDVNCSMDVASFTITGNIGKKKKMKEVGSKRKREEEEEEEEREVGFRVVLYEQSGGCIMIKGSVGKGAKKYDISSLSQILESAHSKLKQSFSSQ